MEKLREEKGKKRKIRGNKKKGKEVKLEKERNRRWKRTL